MKDKKNSADRTTLIAEVAEMYYIDGKDQFTIAKEIGFTRSMVSRMLTEARNRKIVEVKINHPIQLDHDLENSIMERYEVDAVFVATVRSGDSAKLLSNIGRVAAEALKKYLNPHTNLGIAWGTSISAAVDTMEPVGNLPIKVVQLVGAMGGRNAEFDGHAIVQRLAAKLGGEGYFINAPYICQSAAVAQSMRETKGLKETIDLGRQLQVALLGIGSIELDYSSYYLAGLLSEEKINELKKKGVVGDVASNFFTLDGMSYQDDFMNRLIAIKLKDLSSIPVRIGVAGGTGKVKAIIGALNSKLVNVLVTDSFTAKKILEYKL